MTNWLQHKLVHACILTFLLILVLNSRVTLADHERTCDFQSRPHRNGRCGTDLADLLQDLCSVFGSGVKKRHAERGIDENLRDIRLNKKDAFSYLVKRQTTGTITCECCYHACRVEELLQYCDLPRSYYSRSSRSINTKQANNLIH